MTLVHNSESKCWAIINISLGISCGVLRAKWDHDVPFDPGTFFTILFLPGHNVMSKTYTIGTTVQNDCTVLGVRSLAVARRSRHSETE